MRFGLFAGCRNHKHCAWHLDVDASCQPKTPQNQTMQPEDRPKPHAGHRWKTQGITGKIPLKPLTSPLGQGGCLHPAGTVPWECTQVRCTPWCPLRAQSRKMKMGTHKDPKEQQDPSFVLLQARVCSRSSSTRAAPALCPSAPRAHPQLPQGSRHWGTERNARPSSNSSYKTVTRPQIACPAGVTEMVILAS